MVHSTAELRHVCNTCQRRFPTRKGQRYHYMNEHLPLAGSDHQNPQSSQTALEERGNNGKENAQSSQSVSPPVKAYYLLPGLESAQRLYAQAGLVLTEQVGFQTTLLHRDILYTALSTSQEHDILAQLPGICHSERRLRHEGYQLCGGPTARKGKERKNAVPGMLSHLPVPCPSQPKYAALVVGCEMGMTAAGHNELIHLAIVEFFSGRLLVDRLVRPSTPITDWVTRLTGIDDAKMQEAVDRDEALDGWEAARAVLRAIADTNTFIIGQSVVFDLHVLRTAHIRIIDSAIITADAVLKGLAWRTKKRWSLRTLSRELLSIEIRRPPEPGAASAHDPLEDALATREIVLFCMLHPAELERWSQKTSQVFYAQRRKNGGPKPQPRRKASRGDGGDDSGRVRRRTLDDDSSADGERMESWSDAVGWEVWPKSPPSYSE